MRLSSFLTMLLPALAVLLLPMVEVVVAQMTLQAAAAGGLCVAVMDSNDAVNDSRYGQYMVVGQHQGTPCTSALMTDLQPEYVKFYIQKVLIVGDANDGNGWFCPAASGCPSDQNINGDNPDTALGATSYVTNPGDIFEPPNGVDPNYNPTDVLNDDPNATLGPLFECPNGGADNYCYFGAGGLFGDGNDLQEPRDPNWSPYGPYHYLGYNGQAATAELTYSTQTVKFGTHDMIDFGHGVPDPKPIREVDICVLDFGSDPTCSGSRTQLTDSYKFSLFALGAGSEYIPSTAWQYPWTHKVIRQYFDFRYMGGKDVAAESAQVKLYATTACEVADGVYGSCEVELAFGQSGTFGEIGTNHVSSIRVTGVNTEFFLHFGQKFNWGDMTDTWDSGNANSATATIRGSLDMKIHVLPTTCNDANTIGTTQCIHIDYVHVIPDPQGHRAGGVSNNRDQFTLFDEATITMTGGSSGGGGGTAGAASGDDKDEICLSGTCVEKNMLFIAGGAGAVILLVLFYCCCCRKSERVLPQ